MNYQKGNYISTEYGELPIKHVVFDQYQVTGKDGRILWANDVKPIELTEEWLLKLGFTILNFDSYEFDGYKILSKQCGKLQLCADSSNNYKTIENKYLPIILYVHQLQNLYWCLCGKELEFIH